MAYVVLHTFDSSLPEQIEIPLPPGEPMEVSEVYSDTEEKVFVENNVFRYRPKENRKAVAVLLKRK